MWAFGCRFSSAAVKGRFVNRVHFTAIASKATLVSPTYLGSVKRASGLEASSVGICSGIFVQPLHCGSVTPAADRAEVKSRLGKFSGNARVTKEHAMERYLLDENDFKDMEYIKGRNPFSSKNEPLQLYLKTDVLKKAELKWGGMSKLESEIQRRLKEQPRKGIWKRVLSNIKTTFNYIRVLGSKFAPDMRSGDRQSLFGVNDEVLAKMRSSARLVYYAIASNTLVMMAKFGGFFVTGSASMLSEGIHSFADVANQCLLMVGIARSLQAPDVNHPYGYTQERYVWALISGCGIFFLGAGVSVYHGISGLISPHSIEHVPLAFAILGGSLVLEGGTFLAALNQVRRNAKESNLTVKEYVSEGADPNDVAVLMEDGAAVCGVLIAGSCLGASVLTGNPYFDSLGSIFVGGILGTTATFLIVRNTSALIGKAASPDKMGTLVEIIENDPVVLSAHDIKGTTLGVDNIRFKAEVNFDGSEISRRYTSKLDMQHELEIAQSIENEESLRNFLIVHGAGVVNQLGEEVDRVEKNIVKKVPSVRHVDIEIL
eukprot:Nk52_evm3s2356 gene=Nk52_evmTU3s2356